MTTAAPMSEGSGVSSVIETVVLRRTRCEADAVDASYEAVDAKEAVSVRVPGVVSVIEH
jgi:hypothetical protein